MISARLPGGWAIPIAILFILSFPPVCHICLALGLPTVDYVYHSSSVTKLSPFSVASFGVFGLDSRLLPPVHCLENWATFSA
jgi:hypothetical protein